MGGDTLIVVDEKLRTEWFKAEGWYASDDVIREWAKRKGGEGNVGN